jgi:hypothetical protein
MLGVIFCGGSAARFQAAGLALWHTGLEDGFLLTSLTQPSGCLSGLTILFLPQMRQTVVAHPSQYRIGTGSPYSCSCPTLPLHHRALSFLEWVLTCSAGVSSLCLPLCIMRKSYHDGQSIYAIRDDADAQKRFRARAIRPSPAANSVNIRMVLNRLVC